VNRLRAIALAAALVLGASALVEDRIWTITSHAAAPVPQAPGDWSYESATAALDRALAKYATRGWVDYRALTADSSDLDAFLRWASSVSKAEYDSWSLARKKAFLINLYNAATINLILAHYPVGSIKDIGGWFRGPFKQRVVRLWGEARTLDYVEHEQLRKMGDPRIHFAIVCASVGCPRLQSFAYVPERLDEQLDAAAREFINDTRKNRIELERGAVVLSPIFKWFARDFEAHSGTVLAYVMSYADAAGARPVRFADVSVRYGDYDWSLNDLARAPREVREQAKTAPSAFRDAPSATN
jgi:hypothetical protein